jgi:phage tail-like protein
MATQTGEMLTSCRFYFEASDITEKLIQEVSGLSNETDATEEVHGVTKGAIQRRQLTPTVQKFSPLTIKVVATTDRDLYQWFENVVGPTNSGGSNQWATNRKEASISAYDQAGIMQARWEITRAIITKYEGPSFKASDTTMATETMTLSHEGIKRVPV